MNGVVMVDSRYFTPSELYLNHRPVPAEELSVSELVHKYNDEKLVVVFDEIPDKKLLKRLAYPFVIYTTRKPPKWLYREEGVDIREERKFMDSILTKLVHGNKISESELHFIRQNVHFAHIVLSQNLHKLYNRVPSDFDILDRMASSHNRLYPEYLTTIFRANPPDNPVGVKYEKNKYWRNVDGDRNESE